MTSWKWLAILMFLFVAIGLSTKFRRPHLAAGIAIFLVLAYESIRWHVL